MKKLKIGDTIKVIAGKDKGRDGKIEKIFSKDGTVLVPGVNVYKKHVKSFEGQKGGVFDIPRALPFSKVALICPKCKKPTRVAFKILAKEKVRICAKCRKEIDA